MTSNKKVRRRRPRRKRSEDHVPDENIRAVPKEEIPESKTEEVVHSKQEAVEPAMPMFVFPDFESFERFMAGEDYI